MLAFITTLALTLPRPPKEAGVAPFNAKLRERAKARDRAGVEACWETLRAEAEPNARYAFRRGRRRRRRCLGLPASTRVEE